MSVSKAKPERLCSVEGCRSPKKHDDLCAYHETLRDFGPKWAEVAHPNHPEVKEKNGARTLV